MTFLLALAVGTGCSRNTSQNNGKDDEKTERQARGDRIVLQNKGSDTLVNVAGILRSSHFLDTTLADFEQAFRAHAAGALDAALLQAVIDSDGELAAHEFDHAHAQALRDGGPWGQAFPEPLFDGGFELLDVRCVGQRHLRLRLRAPERREPLDAIQFGGWEARPDASRVHLAYRLAPDDYRGNGAVQLVVEHLEPA